MIFFDRTVGLPEILLTQIAPILIFSDAVLLDLSPTSNRQLHDGDHNPILASAKAPTTLDVTTGIKKAIQSVLYQVPGDVKADIQALSIGTTVRLLYLGRRAGADISPWG